MTRETKRILVAEDNPAMLGVIRFNLESAGYRVTVAPCGQTAWELLEAEDFDLLVTDFQMPGMTGGELCERMGNDPRLGEKPVILLTGKGLELDSGYSHLRQSSVVTIIRKPFSPRELIGTVESCLAVGASGA